MKKGKRLIAILMVAATIFTMASAVTASQSGTITESNVVVRVKPNSSVSADNQVAGCPRLSKGTVVEVIEEQGNYYKIQYQGYVGYVLKGEVEIGGAYVPPPSATPAPGAPGTPPAEGQPTGTGTTKEKVYLRKTPNKSTASSNVVTTIPKGKTVEVFGTASGDGVDWYQCRFEGKYVGYARVADIKLNTPSGGNSADGLTVVGKGTTKDKVALYKDPSTSGAKLVTMAKGATVEIYGMTTDLKWYYCRYDGKHIGYARAQDINYSSGGGAYTGGESTPITTADAPIPSSLSLSSSDAQKWKDTNRKFKAAKEKNPDTVGWIFVPGTNIDHPIMFSTSWYYNDHTPDKKSATSGSIYSYSSGVNNITSVSGHNSRVSQTMLHALHHIKAAMLGKSKCEYTKRCSANVSGLRNATVFNITFGSYTAWQVWAAYEVPTKTSADVIKYNCYNHTLSGDALQGWINTQLEKSKKYGINTGVSISTNDKILVLVTCGTSTGDNYARLYMFLKAVR